MNKNIGRRIKQIRTAKKMTQKDLADRMGLSQQTIGQYETSKKPPKIETIEKIAQALEVNPVDIVGVSWFDRIIDTEKLQEEIEIATILENLLSEDDYNFYMGYCALTDQARSHLNSYLQFLLSDTKNRVDV